MQRRPRPPSASPEHWAFFLDLDGTLIDLADTPEGINVDDSTRNLLSGLHIACGGALALVSGRSLADLERHFSGRPFAMAGQHGLEWRNGGGQVQIGASPMQSLQEIHRRLESMVFRHPGLYLENKGPSLAVHYRKAPLLAGHVHRMAKRLLSGFEDRLCLQSGKQVVEIKPAGFDKGQAVAAYMREPPFSGRLPVFIGDDRTDEDGFAMANHLNGLSIKVGTGNTCARYRLQDVKSVREWIASWI